MLHPIMFTDYKSFFSLHSNIKYLFEIANKETKDVFEWCFMNNLSLNADKAKKIFFHK